MQWCQRLDADYGVDPWIWQSLDGPSFHLSSKLCLCNSFHGCFVPKSKESKIQVTADAGVDVEKEEHSSIVGGIAGLYNHSGNQSGGSSEN